MGMPLDMVLACSNHASWNCGLLAFGLPSASNKLSQPDPSDVPSTLKSWEKERVSERDREREWGRETKNESKLRMSQADRKGNRNTKNESTSQTYYYPHLCRQQGHPERAYCAVVQGGVLIHSGSTSWPPPSCYLWWEGTMFLPTAAHLLTLSHTSS